MSHLWTAYAIGDISCKKEDRIYCFSGNKLQQLLEDKISMNEITYDLNLLDLSFREKFGDFPQFRIFAQLDRLEDIYSKLTPNNTFSMMEANYRDVSDTYTHFEYHFFRGMAETRAQILNRPTSFSYRPQELQQLLDQYAQKVEFIIDD